MNIDERIEKLTERHEALAQTVELMLHTAREQAREQGERLAQIITAINQDAENIRALARIAELHQSRIEKLEENRN
jgi:ribosomal protein L12E/L44/L45/RPP1/RPP2